MKNYVWIVIKNSVTNKRCVFKFSYKEKKSNEHVTKFINNNDSCLIFHRDLCFYSEKEAYLALKKLIRKDESLENKRHKKEMKRLINEYKRINRKLEKLK